ncbi:hypothetical protein [Stackebrandtia soli]|uniref:hypothetical protein n=1 Tax=Stackebrandtia soli TaxID=1892856 RepID=UPI0039E76965
MTIGGTARNPDKSFVGRDGPLADLAGWLAADTAGVALLVGRPGSGRSALLRRFTIDPPTPIAAVIDARGRTAEDTRAAVTTALGGTEPTLASDVIRRATAALGPAIVIDGLDEAAQGDRLATGYVLARLADEGARLIVATDHCVQTRRLLRPRLTVDLNAPNTVSGNHRDLSRHLAEVLGGFEGPYGASTTLLAQLCAHRAEGGFLVGRALAAALRRHPASAARDAVAELPDTIGGLIDADLALIAPAERRRVRAMLAALAWAEGPGLPPPLWPILATALSGVRHDDHDVSITLRHASHYIEQSISPTLFRLAHHCFVEHLREVDRGRR